MCKKTQSRRDQKLQLRWPLITEQSDKMSPGICIYSKWSEFSASHQDVSVRTRCVLFWPHSACWNLPEELEMFDCEKECVQLVPGQSFIDYWNCLFSCPVTVATTCVKEWHIFLFIGKIIIIGTFCTRTTDVDWNVTFGFFSQNERNQYFLHYRIVQLFKSLYFSLILFILLFIHTLEQQTVCFQQF